MAKDTRLLSWWNRLHLHIRSICLPLSLLRDNGVCPHGDVGVGVGGVAINDLLAQANQEETREEEAHDQPHQATRHEKGPNTIPLDDVVQSAAGELVETVEGDVNGDHAEDKRPCDLQKGMRLSIISRIKNTRMKPCT